MQWEALLDRSRFARLHTKRSRAPGYGSEAGVCCFEAAGPHPSRARPPVDAKQRRGSSSLDADGTHHPERFVPGEYTVYCFADAAGVEPVARVRVTVPEGEQVEAPDTVLGQ